MREIGEIYTFNGEEYELLENNIIKESKKRGFLIWMNIVAILMLFGLSFIHLVGNVDKLVEAKDSANWMLFAMLSALVYVVVHELLHGWAFRKFGKVDKKDIKFGLVLKSGLAYCCSKVPVKVKAGKLSLMMPVYLICLPIYIISYIISMPWLGVYGIFLFAGSVGDLYYMWKLRYTSDDYYMYEELPTKSGYEIGYLLFKKL